MKLKIYPYSKNFPQQFEKEKEKITQVFNKLGSFRIYHIGSTSVPGLGGKGIIDVMIGIKTWADRNKYIKELKQIGFKHVHTEEKSRIFLSKIRQTKKGDTHIHLVKLNSVELSRHLKFRNFLRRNKAAAKNYWEVKRQIVTETKGSRKLFWKLKSQYIQSLNKKF
jgi:GrpB-like predicted nucleotidyltransferase (UPF0157 family)